MYGQCLSLVLRLEYQCPHFLTIRLSSMLETVERDSWVVQIFGSSELVQLSLLAHENIARWFFCFWVNYPMTISCLFLEVSGSSGNCTKCKEQIKHLLLSSLHNSPTKCIKLHLLFHTNIVTRNCSSLLFQRVHVVYLSCKLNVSFQAVRFNTKSDW